MAVEFYASTIYKPLIALFANVFGYKLALVRYLGISKRNL